MQRPCGEGTFGRFKEKQEWTAEWQEMVLQRARWTGQGREAMVRTGGHAEQGWF